MYRTNEVMQAAFVVDDLDAAIERWMTTIQTGPFFVLRDASPENFIYRGKPAKIVMDIAICQAGPIQVELIKPKSAGPNIYTDMVPAGAQVYHHQCYVTDDLEAERARFAAMDVELAQEADTGGIRFAYFDTRKRIGCMSEVVQRSEGFDDLSKMIADAAVDWDGANPVRSLA